MANPAAGAEPRKGMPDPKLDEAEFRRRFASPFADPAFDAERPALDSIATIAWAAYSAGRKAPVTRKAGPEFADPEYDLSIDWLAARAAIKEAEQRHADKEGPSRILLINSSPRSEHTCPGEMSKTWRLAEMAAQIFADAGASLEILDLSLVQSQYGRHIHPCKACFSTSPALCHWPCSCYPNYSLGQTQDWMNEIYPKWIEAHGVMIVTPVHWYMATSPLKLMMDRLVCADGGNPDPTRTHGKDAKKAQEIEREGWDYPRHLAGRHFAVVAHGDVEGALELKRMLTDWMSFMEMRPAGLKATTASYIGYYELYADSHHHLDEAEAFHEETRNAARALLEAVQKSRAGALPDPGEDLVRPRQK